MFFDSFSNGPHIRVADVNAGCKLVSASGTRMIATETVRISDEKAVLFETPKICEYPVVLRDIRKGPLCHSDGSDQESKKRQSATQCHVYIVWLISICLSTCRRDVDETVTPR